MQDVLSAFFMQRIPPALCFLQRVACQAFIRLQAAPVSRPAPGKNQPLEG